jgi:hypothetical protein
MMLRLCLELEEPGGVHMEPVLSSPVLGSDLSSRVVRTEAARRNTFGTNCFGETGLKIRPEVFRHDNYCEQFFEALYLSTIFLFSHKKEKRR